VKTFLSLSKNQVEHLVKKQTVQNNLQKSKCVNNIDLARLLNNVLKLDRLKRLTELLPAIKNYQKLHPITTFNTLKALKLEFDLDHTDMKFLRDLKVISDIWYKRYLLSHSQEISQMDRTTIEEEKEGSGKTLFPVGEVKTHESADDIDEDLLHIERNEYFDQQQKRQLWNELRYKQKL
ncbi:unnamed protein product, partial [Didymodactylos carnosus]